MDGVAVEHVLVDGGPVVHERDVAAGRAAACQRRTTSATVVGVEVVEDLAEHGEVERHRPGGAVADVAAGDDDVVEAGAPSRRRGDGTGEAVARRHGVGAAGQAGRDEADAARRLDRVAVALVRAARRR